MISADSAVAAIAGYAPGIIAKATAVFAVCACVAALAKRTSAAKRHMLWLCALVGGAALVLLAPISMRIVVPVPSFVPSFVPANLSSSVTNEIDRQDSNRGRDAASHGPAPAMALGRQVESLNSTPREFPGWTPSAVQTVGVMMWLCGVLFVVLRFACACASVNATVRRSRRLDGRRWRAALAGITDRRDITLRVSDELSSPFTLGLVRPTIVLPPDADEWNDERRDAVLRHEIAHIEHGDIATQTIGLLVCALFWFHPLAWLALTQLRHESERAADDRVMSAGTSSIAYAAQLVELARGVSDSRRVPAVAVAIATPPLEHRIRAILDHKRSRGAVAARTRIVGVCTAFAAMLPISGVEFARVFPSKAGVFPHHANLRFAAAPVSVARQVTVQAVILENAKSSSARQEPVVAAPAASIRAEADAPAQTHRMGQHPDFSGVWLVAHEPSADSGTSAVPPTLTIAQTATTITETIRRRATDEFGRAKGVLDATLQLEDGAPAHAAVVLNGNPVRRMLFAMSWDSDTLMMRTAQLGRDSISGAVERFWLTSDGRGLVAHSAPFGYAVNEERTDTLARR